MRVKDRRACKVCCRLNLKLNLARLCTDCCRFSDTTDTRYAELLAKFGGRQEPIRPNQ